MKEEKNAIYYRKLLHYDTVVMLIVSILFAILGVYFISKTNNEDSVPVVLKSIVFIVFEIIILLNKNENTKTIGILAILTGALMSLFSIGDWSLFGIVYLLLGVFYLIHSIIYITKLKDAKTEERQNSNLKYLTIIPNILALLFIFGMIQDDIMTGIIIFVCAVIINIINVILCIGYNKKYKDSVLVYITMAISILAILINGIFLVDDIGTKINKVNKQDSQEYVIDVCKHAEESINSDITNYKALKSLNVNLGENAIISLNDYSNYRNYDYLKELKEKDYNCDGYIVLNWKSNLGISSYDDVTRGVLTSIDMKNYFETANTYINCSGAYTYQTNGFNNNLLK